MYLESHPKPNIPKFDANKILRGCHQLESIPGATYFNGSHLISPNDIEGCEEGCPAMLLGGYVRLNDSITTLIGPCSFAGSYEQVYLEHGSEDVDHSASTRLPKVNFKTIAGVLLVTLLCQGTVLY